jgi:hypothetical protein
LCPERLNDYFRGDGALALDAKALSGVVPAMVWKSALVMLAVDLLNTIKTPEAEHSTRERAEMPFDPGLQ